MPHHSSNAARRGRGRSSQTEKSSWTVMVRGSFDTAATYSAAGAVALYKDSWCSTDMSSMPSAPA
ncbi:hypothetical protein OHB11_37650 [Streptomyces zaomyceticus]|uniref:Uncharacterized protein n=1 Tax=Streptomyces zaomyceticus TaxID=68286 RepID=A0ABZ1LNZ6_9ACTN